MTDKRPPDQPARQVRCTSAWYLAINPSTIWVRLAGLDSSAAFTLGVQKRPEPQTGGREALPAPLDNLLEKLLRENQVLEVTLRRGSGDTDHVLELLIPSRKPVPRAGRASTATVPGIVVFIKEAERLAGFSPGANGELEAAAQAMHTMYTELAPDVAITLGETRHMVIDTALTNLFRYALGQREGDAADTTHVTQPPPETRLE